MRFLGLVLLLSFSVAAVMLIVLGKVWAWAIAVPAFILLLGFLLSQLHSRASFIRFSSEGVTVSYLYHELFFKWVDIEEIRVERKKNLARHTFEAFLIRVVVFLRQLFHPNGIPTVVLRLSNTVVKHKTEFALPYMYQMKPEKLAGLLTEWQQQEASDHTMTGIFGAHNRFK